MVNLKKSLPKLKDVKWKSVRLDDRTILPSDRDLYSKADWDRLLNLDVNIIGCCRYEVVYNK